ncbi:MAG: DNA polymerase ligase N-terminal domain-containing protein [Bythopirellula sp.]
MPRFVLLRHECPADFEKPSHWDFMLEAGGSLRTWEMRQLPSAWARIFGDSSEEQSVQLVELADHRLAYLDYEGPLSGSRGRVQRCDDGTYELLEETSRRLKVRLVGSLLSGVVCLTRCVEGWVLDQRDS